MTIDDQLALLLRETQSLVESTRGDDAKIRVAVLGQFRAAIALQVAYQRKNTPVRPEEAPESDSETQKQPFGDLFKELT